MPKREAKERPAAPARRSSPLIDSRVIYCGDNCGTGFQPVIGPSFRIACIDRLSVWHRLLTGGSNSNRNYEVFWGDMTEPRPSGSGPFLLFEDRHASTQAYIEYMRPRCVKLARVLKKTGSFNYHCDWHASYFVNVILSRAAESFIGCGTGVSPVQHRRDAGATVNDSFCGST